jgi:hypothetical protein
VATLVGVAAGVAVAVTTGVAVAVAMAVGSGVGVGVFCCVLARGVKISRGGIVGCTGADVGA